MHAIQRRVIPLGCLLAVAMASVGCGRSVPRIERPAPVAASSYDAVFDAAVEALRDRHWVVDRRDRRFGVITTEARVAASLFEPWHDDNTTFAQTLESTVNLQRRSVRIELLPADQAEAGPTEADDDADAGASEAEPTAYRMSVTVRVDRRHIPSRELHTARFRRLNLRGRNPTTNQPLRTERGAEESYWLTVDQDEKLADRLLHAILRRASGPPSSQS